MKRAQNVRPGRWQKVAAAVLSAVLVYEVAYKFTVRPEPYGTSGPAYQDAVTTVPVVKVEPRYFEDRVPQEIASVFFAPANWIDRRVRPRVWDPERVGPVIRFHA